jgi:hypothetical protein
MTTQTEWQEAMEKAGLTDERLLRCTNELIMAIESGESKPRHKDKELRKLKTMKREFLLRIKQKRGENAA